MTQDQIRSSQPLLEVSNLTREFPAGEGTVQILKGINLEVKPGEVHAIMGPNGSGKSTLMNLIAGIMFLILARMSFAVHGPLKSSDTRMGVLKSLKLDSVLAVTCKRKV